MDTKSFYNLDYIIEINEKRHEQYTSAYQKVLERFTTIILIYSAITIFLIPLIQQLLIIRSIFFIIGFCLFSLFIIISLIYTVRLIIPVSVAYLEIPKKYYNDIRLQYEQTISDRDQIKELLKASYITELETAVTNNERVFRRKSSFFYNALMFALLSVIPYLACLGFHISQKDDNVQKIEIVNNKKDSTFNMRNSTSMSKATSNNTTPVNSGSTTTTTTQLPGVNNSQVITSSPNMIKENSQNSSSKK